jgi:GT2 family glycosyltransferase
MRSDTTIIVPQFNQMELTLRCCESLLATDAAPPELLIVDDGSELDQLSDELPRLSEFGDLLLLPHRGVTAAWNAAARVAQTRWLIFLNNDTHSLAPWCEQLLVPLRSGAAIMSGVGWRDEHHLPAAIATAVPYRHWLPGWCLAIERTRLLDLGGFDESLSLYFSDTDLQVRLRITAGRADPLIAVEGLPLLHNAHATTHQCADIRERWQHDRRTFHRKWRVGLLADCNVNREIEVAIA